MDYKLVTSNKNKLKEFKRFGFENLVIEKGRDLKEVDSDEQTVILYKALDAGQGRIVEDTSLEVENADIGVNIRWFIDEIANHVGKKAVWRVYLGLNTGETIQVYKAEIHGIISDTAPYNVDSFGFDNYFIPYGTDKTLQELEDMGLKDLYSARKQAVENLLQHKSIIEVPIAEITKWQGNYQND